MTITITALPSQGTVLDTTLIPVETAGVTGRIAALAIKNYVSSGPPLSTLSATTATFTTATADNITVNGILNSGSINTVGDIHIGGNLVVYGTETSAGASTFGNDVVIGGNLTSGTGNVTIGNATISGTATIGNLYATILAVNQPYITTLSTISLTQLTASGNISAGGNLNVTANTKVSGHITPTANLTSNIGSTTTWFNNIYGTAVHALYADLAERYTSDAQYRPGTVVVFGIDTEVTASYQPNDRRVAGVISTNPAYTMNSGITGVDVALQGRVPCQVTGEVSRGDLMVTSAIPGVAMANPTPAIGTVIGKALGSHSGTGVGIIEVVVGRI